MSRVLLSLDLSTSSTGWAKIDIDTKALLSFGSIQPDFKNPKKKGIPQFKYPEAHVYKFRQLAAEIIKLIDDEVELIVIEEINRGKNRLGQKVLDGFHFVLLQLMGDQNLKKVVYIDSDGSDGWRSRNGLKLQLSEYDKQVNKDRKKLNKKLGRGQKQLDLITQKTLACRFVNKAYALNLDVDQDASHGDIADAVGLGHFYVNKVMKNA